MAKMKQCLLEIQGNRLLVTDEDSGNTIGEVNPAILKSAAMGRRISALFSETAEAIAKAPKTDSALRYEAAALMSERNVDAETAMATVTLKDKIAQHMKTEKCSYVDALRAVTRRHPELWARRERIGL